MAFLIKILISALIVAGASELAKRSVLAAAVLVSLPLASILAFSLVYFETKNGQKIAELSFDVFWLVLISLPFFIALPLLLRAGFKFPFALVVSSIFIFAGYAAYVWLRG